MFTRLIPDRSAGESFKYKYKAHDEMAAKDGLNPDDCTSPSRLLPPPVPVPNVPALA